jgi:hypothetical protein
MAAVLGGAGAACALAALGLWRAPQALAIAGAWVGIVVVCAGAGWVAWRTRRASAPSAVGQLVERATNARRGSVLGALTPPADPGASLFALADARAADAVAAAAPRVRELLARGTRRGLVLGAVVAGAGATLLVAAAPAPGRAAFWHPLRALADARAPVRLEVDRSNVRRGDTVTVTITVPGATAAALWARTPGEPWRAVLVALDSAGRTQRQLGPLDTDLYLRATAGSRRSADRKVSVALPAFLADLELTIRFPPYLARGDEPIVAGGDTVLLPEDAQVLVAGTATVPLREAQWIGQDRRAALRVSGTRFSGRLAPASSGTWRLALAPVDGAALEGEPPALHLRLVPDSAPVVSVPVPGRDTTLPVTMVQPLVIDVRDDHGVARIDLVSWRVSQTGKVGEPLRESLDLSGASDRALLQGELDADQRGLLPGDTLRFRVEAWDNAPRPHHGQSAEFALRLPSMEELRAAARDVTRDVAAAADSLAGAQRGLSRKTADLAAERTRDAGTAGRQGAGEPPGALPFQASERAAAIAQAQADLERRAHELAQSVEQLARAAEAAGLTDTAFVARLADVQRLLRQALTPELEQRLRELQDALTRLDPEATRQALQRLAAAQQQFREQLERSQQLLQRAAVEGALASLAADADDLRRRQGEWNREDAPSPDSGAAGRERVLAVRTDTLVHGIAQVARDLAHAAPPPEAGAPAPEAPLAEPQAAGSRALGAMGRAGEAAGERDARRALRAGMDADSALADVARGLRGRRDSLAQAWRRETIDALNRALSETAALAEQEQRVVDALRSGDAGAATRSRQASVEDGSEAVARQIRAAGGRHAMVPPQLDAALGFAQRQMGAARGELEQPTPNTEAAAALAGEAVDALNATAYTLARTLGDVAGAQSGSGFAEAMARLARQQEGMNGEAEGLLPMAGAGGQALLEQLRQLAAQQRALAQQLERMQAAGGGAAAGGLAQEARDLARQLEAGRLDAQTVQRQQRLYRRLLDAGRTLTGPEPDEERQRTSRAASGDSVHVPVALAPGAAGSGPRLRYPTWDELARLSPEQRRLVLEYFRRVNAPATAR